MGQDFKNSLASAFTEFAKAKKEDRKTSYDYMMKKIAEQQRQQDQGWIDAERNMKLNDYYKKEAIDKIKTPKEIENINSSLSDTDKGILSFYEKAVSSGGMTPDQAIKASPDVYGKIYGGQKGMEYAQPKLEAKVNTAQERINERMMNGAVAAYKLAHPSYTANDIASDTYQSEIYNYMVAQNGGGQHGQDAVAASKWAFMAPDYPVNNPTIPPVIPPVQPANNLMPNTNEGTMNTANGEDPFNIKFPGGDPLLKGKVGGAKKVPVATTSLNKKNWDSSITALSDKALYTDPEVLFELYNPGFKWNVVGKNVQQDFENRIKGEISYRKDVEAKKQRDLSNARADKNAAKSPEAKRGDSVYDNYVSRTKSDMGAVQKSPEYEIATPRQKEIMEYKVQYDTAMYYKKAYPAQAELFTYRKAWSKVQDKDYKNKLNAQYTKDMIALKEQLKKKDKGMTIGEMKAKADAERAKRNKAEEQGK